MIKTVGIKRISDFIGSSKISSLDTVYSTKLFLDLTSCNVPSKQSLKKDSFYSKLLEINPRVSSFLFLKSLKVF